MLRYIYFLFLFPLQLVKWWYIIEFYIHIINNFILWSYFYLKWSNYYISIYKYIVYVGTCSTSNFVKFSYMATLFPNSVRKLCKISILFINNHLTDLYQYTLKYSHFNKMLCLVYTFEMPLWIISVLKYLLSKNQH